MKNRELTPEKIAYWAKLTAWNASESASICCGYDPNNTPPPYGDNNPYDIGVFTTKEYNAYAKATKKASTAIERAEHTEDLPSITRGQLDTPSLFRPIELVTWAKRMDLFPDFPELFIDLLLHPDPPSQQGHPHQSLMVRLIIFGSEKYWKNADPDDPGTHPKNDDVSDWFIKNGCPSQTQANTAATMIRPEWASKGRKSDL